MSREGTVLYIESKNKKSLKELIEVNTAQARDVKGSAIMAFLGADSLQQLADKIFTAQRSQVVQGPVHYVHRLLQSLNGDKVAENCRNNWQKPALYEDEDIKIFCPQLLQLKI